MPARLAGSGPLAQPGLVISHHAIRMPIRRSGPMGLASRTNSTFVLCSELRAFSHVQVQTVRSYYSSTLAVPLAASEPCAILLASGTKR